MAEELNNANQSDSTVPKTSFHDLSSLGSGRPINGKQSLNFRMDELMTATLVLDNNYTWFNVSQGMFTTLWFGISRTNIIILNKNKTEEIGNYNRKDFTVVSFTSQM
jgi:hypothetical protein